MCHVCGWNLSYESLTLFDAWKKLRDLKVEDPVFWNELSGEGVASDLPAPEEIVPEDAIDEGDDDAYGDDSSIGLATVVKAIINEGAAALKAVVGIWDGGLTWEAFTEDNNEELMDLRMEWLTMDMSPWVLLMIQTAWAHLQALLVRVFPRRKVMEGEKRFLTSSLQTSSAMMTMTSDFEL